MLTMRVLFLVALLLVWTNAQSQPVSNIDKNQPNAEKAKTKTDNTQERTPAAVGTRQEIPLARADNSGNERQQSSISRIVAWVKYWVLKWIDDPVAVFTSALVFDVILQWIWMIRQERVLKALNAVATRSVEAAMLQTRALVASQIPVVAWVEHKLVGQGFGQPEIDPVPPGIPPTFSRPVFVFQNTGPTKILVLYYAMKWQIAKDLPPEPFFGGMMPANLVLKAEQSHAFTIDAMISPSTNELTSIANGTANLWVFGFVIYNPIFWMKGTKWGYVLDGIAPKVLFKTDQKIILITDIKKVTHSKPKFEYPACRLHMISNHPLQGTGVKPPAPERKR